MQCQICSKMFTPPANQKITQICIQCNEGISQNSSKRNEGSLENTTRKESEKFHNDRMNFMDKQIKDLEDVPDLSLQNTNDFNDQEDDVDETPEEHPSTINRLRRYARKLKPEKISKASELRELKKEYPHSDNKWSYGDRDERQYSKLVSTRELNVAEFVLKWEHEHKKRIPDKMARELLTERKDTGWISIEFMEKMKQKYEE